MREHPGPAERSAPTRADAVLTWRDWIANCKMGGQVDLIDGRIVPGPHPGIQHTRVLVRLVVTLGQYIEIVQDVQRGPPGEIFTAPIGVILDEHCVITPDLVYVSTADSEIVEDRALQGNPKLVTEILSSDTVHRDLGERRLLYERYGVSNYWVVSPELQVIREFVLEGTRFEERPPVAGDMIFRPACFNGWEISLSALWR